MSNRKKNNHTIERGSSLQPAAAKSSDGQLKSIVPGLCLVSLIAMTAICLRYIPGMALLSPMILAIVIGIVWQNTIGTAVRMTPGIKFVLRRFLRLGIILLGFQLTVDQLFSLGGRELIIIMSALVGTFFFTMWLGRALGVDPKLAQLIAAGTSICGASAVIAANSVTRAADEDVAYSVACVTVFGSIAMFLYPTMPDLFHLSAEDYGLWVGASIHEVAQVVAAAFQNGSTSGEHATLAKLSRVVMLAPMIVLLGLAIRSAASETGKPALQVPWFVLAFIGVIGLNSVITVAPEIREGIVSITVFLLTAALAAMGLETQIGKLKAKGIKPLLVGFIASVFISAVTLGMIVLTG